MRCRTGVIGKYHRDVGGRRKGTVGGAKDGTYDQKTV